MIQSICFFSSLKNKTLLDLMQWYANDIEILKTCSKKLIIATHWKEIPKNCDLYFSWFITPSILPLIIAKRVSKPIVVIAGGSEVVKSKKMLSGYNSKSIIEKLAIHFTLRFADHVIAVSDELKKEVLSFVKRDVETIYHGIKTEIFKPVKRKKNIIFCISHLDRYNIERKRIKTIIRAIPFVLEFFPDEKFVIAGQKKEGFSELEELVKSLNINRNVVFPGQISNEKKMEFFNRTKIYLQPTIHEAFGVAIAEAMSCGIPVITSKNSAVFETVGKAGLYVAPENHKELANQILLLLRNGKLRSRLGKMARDRVVKLFSFEKREKRIHDLINKLQQNKSGE